MSHDISSSDGLDQCFANLKRDTIALPTMPLSPAKVPQFLLEFVHLRNQNSTNAM